MLGKTSLPCHVSCQHNFLVLFQFWLILVFLITVYLIIFYSFWSAPFFILFLLFSFKFVYLSCDHTVLNCFNIIQRLLLYFDFALFLSCFFCFRYSLLSTLIWFPPKSHLNIVLFEDYLASILFLIRFVIRVLNFLWTKFDFILSGLFFFKSTWFLSCTISILCYLRSFHNCFFYSFFILFYLFFAFCFGLIMTI